MKLSEAVVVWTVRLPDGTLCPWCVTGDRQASISVGMTTYGYRDRSSFARSGYSVIRATLSAGIAALKEPRA